MQRFTYQLYRGSYLKTFNIRMNISELFLRMASVSSQLLLNMPSQPVLPSPSAQKMKGRLLNIQEKVPRESKVLCIPMSLVSLKGTVSGTDNNFPCSKATPKST